MHIGILWQSHIILVVPFYQYMRPLNDLRLRHSFGIHHHLIDIVIHSLNKIPFTTDPLTAPMKAGLLITLATAVAAISYANPSWSQSDAKKGASHASPTLDARGFIDVWQLREDVAAVESLQTTGDTGYCSQEGSGEPMSPKELKRIEQEEKVCAERIRRKHAVYQIAHETFNRAWLPLIYQAIKKGDQVAEVIMRQCETTHALDRSAIEATCDTNAQRRAVAIKRLLEIGFMPAVDIGNEIAPDQPPKSHPRQKELNQLATLKKIRAGGLGFNEALVMHTGNLAKNKAELDIIERWALIEAVRQDAPRAFTFSPGDNSTGWATTSFSSLRLNRKPLTPGYLTWGQHLHYGGGNSLYDGREFWRTGWGKIIHLENIPGYASGSLRISLGSSLPELLSEIKSNINRYLIKDPRWGVFLLQRIGHHEWVPDGMKSTTHLLDPSWEGVWELEKMTYDWTKPMQVDAGQAVIKRKGDYFQMTMATYKDEDPFVANPFRNVTDCTLRYSGGLTYLPRLVPEGQDPLQTVFGYFYSAGTKRSGSFWREGVNKEAVAPLDPGKRYKQVLMQCKNAEAPDSISVRFLVLAGDILVEVGATSPLGGTLSVRHYRRKK